MRKSELEKFKHYFEWLDSDPLPYIDTLRKLAGKPLLIITRKKIAIKVLAEKLKKRRQK